MTNTADFRSAGRRSADPFPIDVDQMLWAHADHLAFAAKVALTQYYNAGGSNREVELLLCVSDGEGAAGIGSGGVPVDLSAYQQGS